MSLLISFAVQETYAPVILRRRHARRIASSIALSGRTLDDSTQSAEEPTPVLDRGPRPAALLRRAITRPMRFLFTSPVLVLVSTFLAVSLTGTQPELSSILTRLSSDTLRSTSMECSTFFSSLSHFSLGARPPLVLYSTTASLHCRPALPTSVYGLVSSLGASHRCRRRVGFGTH